MKNIDPSLSAVALVMKVQKKFSSSMQQYLVALLHCFLVALVLHCF